MTALQQVNLGTAPAGTDGDPVRTAFVKQNANTTVLATQATLTSQSPNAVRDLVAADMGTRVNFGPTSAATSHFPKASTVGPDQVVAVHNISTSNDITMGVATGSGDTAPAIVVVKPGEMVTWETDGAGVWRTIARKKSINEYVQGTLYVQGAITLSGGVTGALSVSGVLGATSLAIGMQASISAAGAYTGTSASFSAGLTVGTTLVVTGKTTLTGGLSDALPITSGGTGGKTVQTAFAGISAGKVIVSARTAGNTTAQAGSNIAWVNTDIQQPSNCFNGTVFTAPVAGIYRFQISLTWASNLTAGAVVSLNLLKGSATTGQGALGSVQGTATYGWASMNVILSVAAGDTFTVNAGCSAGSWSLINDARFNNLSIEQIA